MNQFTCPFCDYVQNVNVNNLSFFCQNCGKKVKVSLSFNSGKALLGGVGCLGLIILGFIICGGFLSSPSNKKTTKEIGKTFEKIPEENQVVPKKPEPEKAKVTELEPAIIDFEGRKQAFLEETRELNRIIKQDHEKEMEEYKRGKREYDAARKLRLAIVQRDNGNLKRQMGDFSEGNKLLEFARLRFEEIIRDFPDTDGAKKAQMFLRGGETKLGELPPEPKGPVPPVYFSEVFDEEGQKEFNLEKRKTPEKSKSGNPEFRMQLVPSSPVGVGSSKTVHVKGYYRKDGTYVRPHTRSPSRR